MPSESTSREHRPRWPRSVPGWRGIVLRGLLWTVGTGLAAVVSLATIVAVALAVAYPNLPELTDLADYRPKLPLRVFSADGVLIGEFGAHGEGAAEAVRSLLDTIAASKVPLAAVWVYDRGAHDAFNITGDNERSWILDRIGELNRRMKSGGT